MADKIKMNITNADLKIGDVKINSVSSSSVIIFGDAECFYPTNVSVTRGLQGARAVVPGGPGGPVGAIR